jgi:hypothetical protein
MDGCSRKRIWKTIPRIWRCGRYGCARMDRKGPRPSIKDLSTIVTYARFTAAEQAEKTKRYRCRITGGGDRLTYEGDVSTKAAALETFKLLLNSVISTPGAKMCTGDISNMYLYSMLDKCEYIRFKVDMIPPRIIAHYNLTPMIHNGYLYAKIKKAWYGLKQSGKIAHDDLVEHLTKHGYEKTTI